MASIEPAEAAAVGSVDEREAEALAMLTATLAAGVLASGLTLLKDLPAEALLREAVRIRAAARRMSRAPRERDPRSPADRGT